MKKIILIVLFAIIPLYSQVDNWKVIRDVDPLTDKKIVYISTESLEKQKFNYSINSGKLIIRSDGGKISLFVNWGGFVNIDNTFVSYRFGEKPYKSGPWSTSSDNKATFANRPIDTINLMLGEKIAIFRTTPFGDNPVTYSFNIVGLEKLLAENQLEFNSIFDKDESEATKSEKWRVDFDRRSENADKRMDKEFRNILILSFFTVLLIEIFYPY